MALDNHHKLLNRHVFVRFANSVVFCVALSVVLCKSRRSSLIYSSCASSYCLDCVLFYDDITTFKVCLIGELTVFKVVAQGFLSLIFQQYFTMLWVTGILASVTVLLEVISYEK